MIARVEIFTDDVILLLLEFILATSKNTDRGSYGYKFVIGMGALKFICLFLYQYRESDSHSRFMRHSQVTDGLTNGQTDRQQCLSNTVPFLPLGTEY